MFVKYMLKRWVFGLLPSYKDVSLLLKMLFTPKVDLTEWGRWGQVTRRGGKAGGGRADMEACDSGVFILQKDSFPYKRINHRVLFKQKVSCILKEDLIYKKLFRNAAAGQSKLFTQTWNPFYEPRVWGVRGSDKTLLVFNWQVILTSTVRGAGIGPGPGCFCSK